METQQEKRQLTNTVEGFMTEAYSLLDQENYGAAREIFNGLLKKLPNQPNCLFGLALIYYKERHWEEAKRILYHLIDKFPNSSPAVDYLSQILIEENQLEEAKYFLEKNLATEPTNVLYQRNLGFFYQKIHEYQQAAEYFQNAIALNPNHAECYVHLGYVNEKLGNVQQALDCYQHTLRINSEYAEAFLGLGNIALQRKNITQARDYYDHVLLSMNSLEQPEELDEYSEALIQFGKTALAQQKWFLAQRCFETCTLLQPNETKPFVTLGDFYEQRGQLSYAKHYYQQALTINKHDTNAMIKLGNILAREHQPVKARTLFEKALCEKPSSLFAERQLAATYDASGDWQEAEHRYHRILKAYESIDFSSDTLHRTNYATTRFSLSLIQLRNRNYQEGWSNYQFRKNIFSTPYLDGIAKLTQVNDLTGKKVLIVHDQHIEDLLMLVRFCALLKSRGAYVRVYTKSQLTTLLRSSKSIDEVTDTLNLEECVDFQQLLITDIPFYFKINEKDLLANEPYLFTTEEKLHEVDTYLVGSKRLKVGICYQGNRGDAQDSAPSLHLANLEPLFKIPDIDFYNLVIEMSHDRQSKHFPPLQSLQEHLNDYSDLAGVIAKLDLVISVDIATAHLAGAMHRPCWVMLPRVSDWRWQKDRIDSPWYPTLKLYRQTHDNRWDVVVKRLLHDLMEL